MALTSAYGGACAVTGEHSGPVLAAAHIQPFSRGGEHVVPNGLLLRADILELFDAGYVTITPEYRFEVSARLKEERENGRAYCRRHGEVIRAPVRVEDRPSRVALGWHMERVFLG